MNRREFLVQGAALGVAGAAIGTTGCATAQSLADSAAILGFDVDDFLSRARRDLNGISPLRVIPSVSRELTAQGCSERGEDGLGAVLGGCEDLVARSAKALYVSSAFRDVPEALRPHPGIQAIVRSTMPDMDSAVSGMRQYLADLTPGEKADIHAVLKANPELAERICEALDAQVGAAWVQPERRRRQRTVMKQLAWRMKMQGPGAVIDEHLDKARRWEALYPTPVAGGAGQQTPGGTENPATGGESADSAGSKEYVIFKTQQQSITARIIEELPGGFRVETEDGRRLFLQKTSLVEIVYPDGRVVRMGADAPAFSDTPSPGSGVATAGAWMMGIGLVSGLGGILLLAVPGASGVGVVGTTIGGALILLGLLVWIVGSLIKLGERPATRRVSSPPSRRVQQPAPHPAEPPAQRPPPPSPPDGSDVPL